jgi:outer membrane protein OmpA-like peptidoglycan-associated protein
MKMKKKLPSLEPYYEKWLEEYEKRFRKHEGDYNFVNFSFDLYKENLKRSKKLKKIETILRDYENFS